MQHGSRGVISHYEVMEKIGEGGMGEVFKARDVRLDRLVALKLLHGSRSSTDDRHARFVNEAKSASALNHPHVVTIYEIGNDADTTFIAMEYVDGVTLGSLLSQQKLPVSQALGYAIQVADAIAAAHAAGIIHRDLKPANIMIRHDGVVKVVDFGIAKLTERVALKTTDSTESIPLAVLTTQGSILGTAAYMSPEQAEAKPVDTRSDIFSFGAVLYEMLTGQRAFSGDSAISTLAAILNHDPPPVNKLTADVPSRVNDIVARCLRKNRDDRFQEMVDIKVALTALLEPGTGLVAIGRRTRLVWLVGGCIMTAIAALLLLKNYDRGRPAQLIALPLTSYIGSEYHATFSPDGSQIAFDWDGPRRQNLNIYIKAKDAAEPTALTTGPDDDENPAWSPDGRSIAFARTSNKRQSLYITTPVGGSERRLADFEGRVMAWSPDSSRLIASSRRSPDGPLQLFTFDVSSGAAQPLTHPPANCEGDDYPVVAPDRAHLAFVRNCRGSKEILVLELARPADDKTTVLKESGHLEGIAWSPDSSEIVYSSNQNGAQRLWRIPVKGGTPKLLDFGDQAYNPVIFPGSGASPARLVYEKLTSSQKLWRRTVRPASSSAAPQLIAPSSRREESPRFSTDGRRIAFESDRSGNFEIWVCEADGSRPARLTNFKTAPAGSPRWSPDSRRIVFDQGARGQRSIYIIEVNSGIVVRLTSTPSDDIRPSWSADGKSVYFTSNRSGKREIWKTAADGSAAVKMTSGGGFEAFESVDGQTVYYVRDNETPGLWKVPVGGGPEELVNASVAEGMWSVARDGIFYVSGIDAVSRLREICFLRFGAQRSSLIAPVEADTTGFAIAPDGTTVITVTTTDGVDLMTVDNFR